MAKVNRWKVDGNGNVTANFLARVTLTLTHKSSRSTAEAAVGDVYEIDCIVKSSPSLSDAPVIGVVTDSPDQPVGRRRPGKSEGFETIELQTEHSIRMKREFMAHQAAGDVFSYHYEYDDPIEPEITEEDIPSVRVLGCGVSNGETNAASQMSIKLQPEGGSVTNMGGVTSKART